MASYFLIFGAHAPYPPGPNRHEALRIKTTQIFSKVQLRLAD